MMQSERLTIKSSRQLIFISSFSHSYHSTFHYVATSAAKTLLGTFCNSVCKCCLPTFKAQFGYDSTILVCAGPCRKYSICTWLSREKSWAIFQFAATWISTDFIYLFIAFVFLVDLFFCDAGPLPVHSLFLFVKKTFDRCSFLPLSAYLSTCLFTSSIAWSILFWCFRTNGRIKRW